MTKSDQTVECLASEFRTRGYVVARQMLGDSQIRAALAECLRLSALAVDVECSIGDFNLESETGGYKSQRSVDLCYKGTLRKVQNVVCYSWLFLSLSREEAVVWWPQRLLKTKVELGASVLWFKPGRIGSAKPWHQDAPYLQEHRDRQIAIWVALDEADEANGCVWFLPGSHERGLLPHCGIKPTYIISSEDAKRAVSYPLMPGDAVIFHSLTLHHSDINRSARPRRALMYRFKPACTCR